MENGRILCKLALKNSGNVFLLTLQKKFISCWDQVFFYLSLCIYANFYSCI
ncbi:hypothetical protein BDFB_014426 [Asbolus verrucosus]|uniref:Uncharacterized protein n=1 Tax=Asbolus verrucosus TaxID=1661398 RepID=A0A482VT70_ASBVE|nr:hypothetical protein BDFB_014426 [Asbolus verrucosus]